MGDRGVRLLLLSFLTLCNLFQRGIFSEALKKRAIGSRDGALGDRSKRTRSHAVMDPDTGTMTGGTEWERSLPGKFNPKRGRCYPFGCTFQRQRSLYSPCAAGKHSVVDDKTLKMRTELTEVKYCLCLQYLF